MLRIAPLALLVATVVALAGGSIAGSALPPLQPNIESYGKPYRLQGADQRRQHLGQQPRREGMMRSRSLRLHGAYRLHQPLWPHGRRDQGAEREHERRPRSRDRERSRSLRRAPGGRPSGRHTGDGRSRHRLRNVVFNCLGGGGGNYFPAKGGRKRYESDADHLHALCLRSDASRTTFRCRTRMQSGVRDSLICRPTSGRNPFIKGPKATNVVDVGNIIAPVGDPRCIEEGLLNYVEGTGSAGSASPSPPQIGSSDPGPIAGQGYSPGLP